MSVQDSEKEHQPNGSRSAAPVQFRSNPDKVLAAYTKHLAIATWVIAFAATASFLASLLSWVAIRDQLAEMRLAGSQTDKMITVNSGLAEIAAKQTTILQMQLEASRRAERPYISFDFGDGPELTKGLILWNVNYSNVGRTIARKFINTGYMRVGHDVFRKTSGPYAPSDMVPGQSMYFTISSDQNVTKEQFSRLMSDNFAIAVLVSVVYEDETGTRYTEEVCMARQANGAINERPVGTCNKE